MQTFERAYLELLDEAIYDGNPRMDRTGVGTRALFGRTITHRWSEGFPLITHRQLSPKAAIAEMLCFIHGYTNVDLFKQFGCNWWEANLKAFNDKKVAQCKTDEGRRYWEMNRYLGPVYGAQWRGWASDDDTLGVDQLKWLLAEATNNPSSRRLLVTAWNPAELDDMALPPCHYSWQIFLREDNKTLDLLFTMRSVDIVLGMPNDIIAYAYLQLCLCRHLGYHPGKLIGHFADTHVYENHVAAIKPVVKAELDCLTARVRTAADWKWADNTPTNLFDITPAQLQIVSIEQGPKLSFEMAV